MKLYFINVSLSKSRQEVLHIHICPSICWRGETFLIKALSADHTSGRRRTYLWGTSSADTGDRRTPLHWTGSLFYACIQSRSRFCWRLEDTACSAWSKSWEKNKNKHSCSELKWNNPISNKEANQELSNNESENIDVLTLLHKSDTKSIKREKKEEKESRLWHVKLKCSFTTPVIKKADQNNSYCLFMCLCSLTTSTCVKHFSVPVQNLKWEEVRMKRTMEKEKQPQKN